MSTIKEKQNDMPISKLRVLMVDDMESMRSVIKAILIGIGVEKVIVAIDGSDAIQKLSNHEVDLIISDWDMPKMNGLEFLEYVRKFDEYKNVPFILLTASKDRDRVQSAIAAGVDDFLSKPFTPASLEKKMKRALAKKKAVKSA